MPRLIQEDQLQKPLNAEKRRGYAELRRDNKRFLVLGAPLRFPPRASAFKVLISAIRSYHFVDITRPIAASISANPVSSAPSCLRPLAVMV